jgi:hypothetical protein
VKSVKPSKERLTKSPEPANIGHTAVSMPQNLSLNNEVESCL